MKVSFIYCELKTLS